MKSLLIIATALSLWLSATIYAQAQDQDQTKYESVEKLTNLKEKVIQEEKNTLKTDLESINARLQSNAITETEAETLKQEAAEKHALNIENRLAIIDNQVAFIKRNGIAPDKKEASYIMIGLGNEDADNERVWGVSVKNNKKKIVYDRRTTSGAVFAFGLNNVITEGESLQDSDFKVAGSRFAEIGWDWKTRVFKNTNWLRIKYGLLFQFNGLKPTDNRFYVDTGEQTELQTYPENLKKSKFRMDNLVVPVFFEFGPSKKIEHDNYFRYNNYNQINVGIGGYAGINLGARQKLKYEEDGEDRKDKLKANYNTNNFIYGLSAYVGWNGTSIYAKYDLNTIFKNNPVDQRNVSLGLRFDLD